MDSRYELFVEDKWKGYRDENGQQVSAVVEAALTAGALCEESGEAFGEFKKCLRQDSPLYDDVTRYKILFELGDAMYYLTRCTNLLGFSIHEMLSLNMGKLSAEKPKEYMSEFLKDISARCVPDRKPQERSSAGAGATTA